MGGQVDFVVDMAKMSVSINNVASFYCSSQLVGVAVALWHFYCCKIYLTCSRRDQQINTEPQNPKRQIQWGEMYNTDLKCDRMKYKYILFEFFVLETLLCYYFRLNGYLK